MKNKLLRKVIMCSRYAFIGFLLQTFLFSLLFAAKSDAQEVKSVKEVFIDVNFNNSSINTVLKTIEQKTSYRFSYDRMDLDWDFRFSFTGNNVSVAEVLILLSEKIDLKFRQINNYINVSKVTEAHKNMPKLEVIIQTRTITGKVTSFEDDEELPGVNVVEKGTTNGTVTNVHGEYSLEVSEGATLVFSSVGYTSEEVVIGNRSTIDLVMTADIQQLQELVVIGYGSVKKSDLTGAVASVSAEELKKVPVTSIDHGLQGRAPGVQVTQASAAPGGAISIRIRGGNSVNSGNEPLYVVDGFPIYSDNNASSAPRDGYPTQAEPNALAFLNPNDIESIEILKDASATSIYGSRGANGVVLITTKRGREGRTLISYEGSYGWQQVRKQIDMLNAREFAEIHNEGYTLDGRDLLFDGDPFESPEQLGEGTNWQEEIFRTAPMQNHQLSFTGGSKTAQYALSANYFDQQGIVIGSRFQRGTIRSNFDLNPVDKVKIGSSFTYSYSVSDFAQSESSNTGANQGIIGSALFNSPYPPVYNENGDFFTNADRPPGRNFRIQDNPVALGTLAKDEGKNSRFLGNMYAEYEIVKNLKAKVSFGADILNNKRDAYFPRLTRLGDRRNGLASQGTRTMTSILNENILSYANTFNEIHDLNIVAGFSYQEQVNTSSLISAQDFINDNLQDHNIGAGALPGIPSSNKSKWQMASWIGRINYTLNNKYLFTFSGRADGSSRFGAGNKWAFFPSGALAWRMSDEQFMQNIKAVSDLKLRVSYGITGNTEIPVYQSLARLNIANYTINGNLVTGIAPGSIPNPDLKWETTAMFNIGLDAGFLDNRIILTSNYYHNKTEDLLFNVTIPITSGFGSTFTNAGSLQNMGIELGIDSDVLVGAFKWDTQLNWSMNRNEILDIGESEPFNANNVSSGMNVPGSRVEPGLPVGAFWGFEGNGIYNTVEETEEDPWADTDDVGNYRFVDQDGNDNLDSEDRVMIGDPNPNFIWAFNNNFTFKNFDLNVFINGVQGADIFNPHVRFIGGGRANISNQARHFVTNRWTPENPDGVWGRANSGDNGIDNSSSFWVFDGSFIRVRNVTLGYNIPTEGSVIRNARVYLSAQNLLTITDYWGFDPEVNSQGQNNLNQGIDANAYPTARTFMLGVNIGF